MNARPNPHLVAYAESVREALIDDVTHIIQRVPYIERYPAKMFSPGLVSELAEASDRLAVAVSKLEEAQGAAR